MYLNICKFNNIVVKIQPVFLEYSHVWGHFITLLDPHINTLKEAYYNCQDLGWDTKPYQWLSPGLMGSTVKFQQT